VLQYKQNQVEIKKTDKANLELRRKEMFLVALVLILSSVYMALGWDTTISQDKYNEMVDEAFEEIDFDKLKRNNDMVAAISETEEPAEQTKIKPAETLIAQPQQEATTSKLLVGDGETDIPEAKVEEVKPQVLENPDDKDLPEGFHVVEQLPEFPGGASAFMKWITANVKYPSYAEKNKIEGKVVVSFIVDTEGNVTKLKIEKSPNTQLSNEVMRAMRTMPKWKPGIQNGKICSTMIAVPINFDL